MNPRYRDVTDSLRTAYDGAVEHRDRTEKAPWKLTERVFLGVYGRDQAEEGPFEDGIHHPPRFFSWRTDEQIQQFARGRFDIVDFHVAGPGREHFESLTLRR